MIHNHDKKYVGLPGKDVNGFVNSIMRKQDLPIFSTKEYDFHQEQIEHMQNRFFFSARKSEIYSVRKWLIQVNSPLYHPDVGENRSKPLQE